jgi:hypothetical protein
MAFVQPPATPTMEPEPTALASKGPRMAVRSCGSIVEESACSKAERLTVGVIGLVQPQPAIQPVFDRGPIILCRVSGDPILRGFL